MSLPLTAEQMPFMDRVKQGYCLYFKVLKNSMKLMIILAAFGIVIEGGALVFGVPAEHAGNVGLIFHILASAFFLPELDRDPTALLTSAASTRGTCNGNVRILCATASSLQGQ